MPRSDRRDELAEVRERIARAHCDANEDRWVEMQAAMLVYSRSPVEHTILRSRDEHDGVCGLWWLLSDLELLSLNGVESFGGNACSRVCVCGNGDVQAKLSTAQHTSCQCRRQAELRCRQARERCGSALDQTAAAAIDAPSVWRAFPANHHKGTSWDATCES